MIDWPEKLFDLIFFPAMDTKLNELALMAEPENWDYQNTSSVHNKPILFNYLQYTYRRLQDENKIYVSDDGQALTFNTGLVTQNQEEIYCYCTSKKKLDASQNWFFTSWRRKGEHELTKFSQLPGMAHYFEDPSALVFDPRKDIRANIEHIVSENKERFPEPYRSMGEYTLQTFLKGALDNAKERVRRNYKTAIPHFYRGKIQLLLPLCLGNPNKADLAIVVEDMGNFYRAATCLTLDMAYNNARQLARPDRDWLIP